MTVTRQKYTTPPGVLSWLFITGQGVDNYNKDGKIFKGTVNLTGKHKDKFIEDVDNFYNENKVKGLKLTTKGYRHPFLLDENGEKIPQLDSDGEPVLDGEGEQVFKRDKDVIEVTFSTGLTFPDGKPKTIKTYNAKGNEVALGEAKIGNGSKGCLVGTMSTFERQQEQGITFYLDGVQLITFKPYEGGEPELEEYEEEDAFMGFEESSGVPLDNSSDDKSKKDNAEVKEAPKKAKPKL